MQLIIAWARMYDGLGPYPFKVPKLDGTQYPVP